jgi:hypothetical protein
MGSGARHGFAEHTDELELGLAADSLGELFAEAGRALAEVMAGAPPPADGAPSGSAHAGQSRDVP